MRSRLALSAFSLLACLPVYAQTCATANQLAWNDYGGGSQYATSSIFACIQNNSYGANYPQMPQVTETAGNACDYQASINVSFHASAAYTTTGQIFNQTYGTYESPVLDTNETGDIWLVDWSDNLWDAGQSYEGGNAVLDQTAQDTNGQFISLQPGYPFIIAGLSPSNLQIVQYVSGLTHPWWFGRTVLQESSYQQFNPVSTQTNGTYGAPVFGPPDGFGLTQMDGTYNYGRMSDGTLWSWTQNMADGTNLANSYNGSAHSYMSNILSNYVNSGGNLSSLPTTSYASCGFSPTQPTGQSSYGDAEWMTEYNGGHFLTFNGLSPNFRYGYVSQVCGHPNGTFIF